MIPIAIERSFEMLPTLLDRTLWESFSTAQQEALVQLLAQLAVKYLLNQPPRPTQEVNDGPHL